MGKMLVWQCMQHNVTLKRLVKKFVDSCFEAMEKCEWVGGNCGLQEQLLQATVSSYLL